VPLLYEGEEVELTAQQEEICSFYAAMPDDGPQLGNPKTRKVFQKNFMADFKEVLVAGHVVKKFEHCDFSLIATHLDKQRSLKKAASLEEKAQGKAVKDELVLRYGYALIDGRMEKVSLCVCGGGAPPPSILLLIRFCLFAAPPVAALSSWDYVLIL
jgi:DNA topoisomerase-1